MSLEEFEAICREQTAAIKALLIQIVSTGETPELKSKLDKLHATDVYLRELAVIFSCEQQDAMLKNLASDESFEQSVAARKRGLLS